MAAEIPLTSTRRNELIDLTSKVEAIVSESGVKNGFCLVYAPHTTAAITINENADPSVKNDILNYLSKLVPENSNFSHSEGNSDAHIKSSFVGCSEVIPIKGGKLALGTWQGVMFAEFDGPRSRKAIVNVVGD
ncbi:MAG: secondary thiamine-phosphate synthase enzyme YjbQ [Candidatus Diapherotrites archaeon]